MSTYATIQNMLRSRPQKWLVTGCAGFIGSHLLETLLKLDQKVVGLDNFATGRRQNLEQVLAQVDARQQKNFSFIKGDIRSRENLNSAMDGVDFILHQAALGSVPRSFLEPILYHDVNATGFLNLLVAAKDHGIERLVYASSSSVYGNSPTLPKVESVTGTPLSPYAASKASNEIHAAIHAAHFHQTLVGLRYFNVFGPRQDPAGTYAAVIPRWIANLLKQEASEIYGDGETSRDFCFVHNIVQANLLAAFADAEKVRGEVFNVACGDRTTLNELYRDLNHLLAQKIATFRPQTAVYQDFRAGDIRHSFADISKARSLLGFEPSHSVKMGLREALDWYIGEVTTVQSAV